ncbi:metallophosphoesterase [Pueribacillus theae]
MRRMFTSLGLILFFALFLYANNNIITINKEEIHLKDLPEDFDGMRIVHLSDLHDAAFGERQNRLLKKVRNAEPDFIFFTGDLVDRNRYRLENSLHLIDGLLEIAPVYYVTGNHEISANKVEDITEILEERGVIVLRNHVQLIKKGNSTIAIGGIDDPLMRISELEDEKTITSTNIEKAFTGIPEGTFALLLSHRPEQMEAYVEKEMNVVFSGHAHGGQVRIPLVGGLVAPGQGLFPKYTSGIYSAGETHMVVNRGLGNSLFPFRIFNFPEVIVVTLKN